MTTNAIKFQKFGRNLGAANSQTLEAFILKGFSVFKNVG